MKTFLKTGVYKYIYIYIYNTSLLDEILISPLLILMLSRMFFKTKESEQEISHGTTLLLIQKSKLTLVEHFYGFLQIVERCFPNNHPLHKIFNGRTLKLSYSCMPNMKSIISSRNKHILSNLNSPTQQPDTLNCRKKQKNKTKQIVRSNMHPNNRYLPSHANHRDKD